MCVSLTSTGAVFESHKPAQPTKAGIAYSGSLSSV